MDVTLLAVGAGVVFCASVLGGVTGFGFALVCTPLLLLAGFELADIVVVNLIIGLLTRLAAVARLREAVNRRRSGYLVLGCVPGLLVGYLARDHLPGAALKVTAGAVAVAVAAYLLLRPPGSLAAAPAPAPRLPSGVAGLLGGFLGITTSLNGPPPVILLSRQRAEPTEFIADMAVYLVFCNGLALVLIGLAGGLPLDRLALLVACWLPGALVGNAIGLSYGPRLPVALFRSLTLGLVLATGLTTIATSLGSL